MYCQIPSDLVLTHAWVALTCRHTVRYLSIYLMLLPLLLWGSGCGWSTPALAAIVAFLLLATENIGAQIEEPFKVCSGLRLWW